MKHYKYLSWIVALYLTMQLASDVTAGKIVQLGFLTVSVTALYFPITYIFADVLTEVYGYSVARSVVWKVLFASILAGIVYMIALSVPAAPSFNAAEAYSKVLGGIPRIIIGGWIAVWAGGIANDYVLAKMKIWTNGKYLWARTIGSTILGELVNTVLFYTIALYAVIPNGLLITSVLSGWFLKVVVEVVFTPWTYWVVGKLKNLEHEDYYDTNTNFNPFIVTERKS